MTRRYRDPLDEIWTGAAARIGLRVVRSSEVYASTDGQGTLAIGTGDTLDADDCLAQMIFHELCHSLVEGLASLDRVDWGLCNETDRDVPKERACLRLQATLARPWGLGAFLAPTTEHRSFYDGLGDDALSPPRSDEVLLARRGAARSQMKPWAPHVEDALAATLAVVKAAQAYAAQDSLAARLEAVRAMHPVGMFFEASPTTGRCGDCGWSRMSGRGKAVLRCQQAGGARVDADWPACERHEAALDCLTCGACCREAFHSVTVSPRDPVVKLHPELVVRREGRTELARSGARCAALGGGPPQKAAYEASASYTCAIYTDRPATCRDFELGSDNCLTARRRVGLSR